MSSPSLTAIQLHERYSVILSQAPLSEFPSPYLLHKALTSQRPVIKVSHGAVKTWWNKYRQQAASEVALTAADFDEVW